MRPMSSAACPPSVSGSAVPLEQTWPTELKVLLGPDADEFTAEYFGALGGDAVECRPRQVAYRPGRSSTVRYDVRVRWANGDERVEPFVAMIGNSLPDDATRMGSGDRQVALWHWPNDPLLPGLPAALDRGHVEHLFGGLGLGNGPITLRTRAYRPGRRAVIEADNGRVKMYLKVVRPHRAAALHETHRNLAGELPVPDSIGWTDDGIVVLPGIAGSTLRQVLRDGGPLPGPADIEALLDRLPGELVSGPRRSNWLVNARHHAKVIAATVPTAAGVADDFVAQLDERADRTLDHRVVPVHGDMYESQVMVERGRITGLLDVDTAGAGHRVDDIANFCAHLSVLALVTRPADSIRRFGSSLLTHAEATHDRTDLRLRTAAAVFGLATGSFRVLESDWTKHTLDRIDLATQWVASADRAQNTR